MPRAKKDRDNEFDNPGAFIREKHRLQEQNDKLWKKYGDLQFGPKNNDGVRMPGLARPKAARINASLQLKNMGSISSIDKWTKLLKR